MKVFIAIPAYRGIVCPPFLDALEETTKMFTERELDHELHILSGCPYIQVARNQLVHDFLESDCDKIFFLDDDISWNPIDAVRVVTAPSRVTAAVYPMKRDVVNFPVVLRTTDEHKPVVEGGALIAARVPTGFLCIDRSVFGLVEEVHPHLKYQILKDGTDDEWVDFFDYFPQGVRDGCWVGEDFAFCDLWRDAGGRIHVLPDVDFKHHSHDKTWSGNLWSYLTSLPGGAKEDSHGG